MSAFPSRSQATRLAFDKNSFSVYLADGRILNVPLAFFPRLLNADKSQREHYEPAAVAQEFTGTIWTRTSPSGGYFSALATAGAGPESEIRVERQLRN